MRSLASIHPQCVVEAVPEKLECVRSQLPRYRWLVGTVRFGCEHADRREMHQSAGTIRKLPSQPAGALVTCPECLGTGEDLTPSSACELCHGDGAVRAEGPDPSAEDL
jgi:hypothetical protein